MNKPGILNRLTSKQRMLVAHLEAGCTWSEAAEEMNISKRSIYRLASNIRRRLGIRKDKRTTSS